MGEALENYIKDAFAGTFGITDELVRMKTFNQEFSWLGSQNNPPDIMIKGGDAIEVKKTQSANSNLTLNSSYPKTDLRGTSPMIIKSISSRKRIADKLEELGVNKLSVKSIVGVAQYLNPMIRGWINYYGKFKMYELTKVFRLLSRQLVWWARKRYKRYKTSIRKAYKWLSNVRKQYPTLFYYWNFF